MVRPTIDLNPVKLKYYPFMTSLDKCSGSCDVLWSNISVPKRTKDINIKAFHMITNKKWNLNNGKTFSCDCTCKFNSTTCNSH